jgi:adenine-specific DNA-methyltransferase
MSQKLQHYNLELYNNTISESLFCIQNRRYLGNKYKLIQFIKKIVEQKCGVVKSFCDIFAGTGVVGEAFNDKNVQIIANDLLYSNYICLSSFLEVSEDIMINIKEKISILNDVIAKDDNYFSDNFGGTFFTIENARKIGEIRERIENISENETGKKILLCSLVYAVDKVANTVGHYDAFRKNLDATQPLKLLIPSINFTNNANNKVYREDANQLIRKIDCDVLYIDPPYNSRQYSDAYHLLENLAEWKKPDVFGIAKKMNRNHIKSQYCLKNATSQFADLIQNAHCKHILLSYNNTQETKHGRSNARIQDNDIIEILKKKGDVEIFEQNYKAFTTGKSKGDDNVERIFYCKVLN